MRLLQTRFTVTSCGTFNFCIKEFIKCAYNDCCCFHFTRTIVVRSLTHSLVGSRCRFFVFASWLVSNAHRNVIYFWAATLQQTAQNYEAKIIQSQSIKCARCISCSSISTWSRTTIHAYTYNWMHPLSFDFVVALKSQDSYYFITFPVFRDSCRDADKIKWP